MKMTRNTAVKMLPPIVATSLVKCSTRPTKSRIRKMIDSPMGTSTPRMRMFSGTLNSCGLRSLKRSTTIATRLKAKLHTMPKA